MSTRPNNDAEDDVQPDAADEMEQSTLLGQYRISALLLAAVTLLTVVTGVITTGFSLTGITAIPAAFVIVFALLPVLFNPFFVMGREIPGSSKAFYALCAAGLSKPIGIGVALVSLAMYASLQVGLYGIFGDVTLTTLTPILPSSVIEAEPKWWWFGLAAWVVTLVRGRSRLKQNSALLLFFVAVELVWIAVFTVSNFLHPAANTSIGSTLSAAFIPTAPALMGTAVLVCVLSIIGIESPPLYIAQARAPKHTTAKKAAYIALAVMFVVYISASVSMIFTAGPSAITGAAGSGPLMVWLMAEHNVGPWFAVAGQISFLVTAIAAAVAFHVMVTFYMKNLGLERIIPSWFGELSLRTQAPANASLVMSGLALLVIVTVVVTGGEPVEGLFFTGGTIGALGVLMILFLTSLSFIGYFAKSPGKHPLRTRVVFPIISAAATFTAFVSAVWKFDVLLGKPGSTLGWWIGPAYFALLLVGVGYGLWLRRNRPERYEGIASRDDGRLPQPGHKAVTA